MKTNDAARPPVPSGADLPAPDTSTPDPSTPVPSTPIPSTPDISASLPPAPSPSAAVARPADPLRGLAWLLVLQVAGEGLARGLGLPFPGPVVGMLLLMPALTLPIVREPVALCADFLLRHLSLLFVPVGVGVMSHLDLLEHFGGRMLLVIVLSTWAGMATTAWVLSRPERPAGGSRPEPSAEAPRNGPSPEGKD